MGKTMGERGDLEYQVTARSALHTTSHRELRNHGDLAGHALQRKIERNWEPRYVLLEGHICM